MVCRTPKLQRLFPCRSTQSNPTANDMIWADAGKRLQITFYSVNSAVWGFHRFLKEKQNSSVLTSAECCGGVPTKCKGNQNRFLFAPFAVNLSKLMQVRLSGFAHENATGNQRRENE